MIRDEEGNVLMVAMDVVMQSLDGKMAKALAMRFLLHLARDACFLHLEMKRDNLDLILTIC